MEAAGDGTGEGAVTCLREPGRAAWAARMGWGSAPCWRAPGSGDRQRGVGRPLSACLISCLDAQLGKLRPRALRGNTDFPRPGTALSSAGS